MLCPNRIVGVPGCSRCARPMNVSEVRDDVIEPVDVGRRGTPDRPCRGGRRRTRRSRIPPVASRAPRSGPSAPPGRATRRPRARPLFGSQARPSSSISRHPGRRISLCLMTSSSRRPGPVAPRPVREGAQELLAHLLDAAVEVAQRPALDTDGRQHGHVHVPGRMVPVFRGPMSSALRITIGTIGTLAAIAMRNAPFLNGPTARPATRSPSARPAWRRPPPAAASRLERARAARRSRGR